MFSERNGKLMEKYKRFFVYVIPSILAFALSGVYAIVDGYFVGNRVGDIGISTINIAYPIVALIQAAGTGIGMGGAVYYSIFRAEGKEKEAREYTAGTLWMLLAASAVLTVFALAFMTPLLKLLGAEGEILRLGEEYIRIIAFGAVLQVIGTGLIPLIRNNGGAMFAMAAMVLGFLTNILLDFLFVWVYDWSTGGAAWATIIGQGAAMAAGAGYLLYKKQMTFQIAPGRMGNVAKHIIRIGLAPFGLALTPNFSLIFINRFSVMYGGEQAVAVYACIAYIITIVYLVLQGVGDGIQPLMSEYYGAKKEKELHQANVFAYVFSLILSAVSIVILYLYREETGVLFGASGAVTEEVAAVFPIFLLAVPFIAINRVTTASFYATEKSGFSYILTYVEPVAMLILMLILPPLFGGQIMIWWSATIARIFSAVIAAGLKLYTMKKGKYGKVQE